MTRLIRAAGLRWPAEEDFEFGKDCFGLGSIASPALHCDRPACSAGDGRPGDLRRYRRPAQRPYRHPGAAARPAAARTPARTGDDPADRTRGSPAHRRRNRPTRPAALTEHWSGWTRIRRARARWFHQRARLERDQEITMNVLVI